jgi:DNA-binding winged helix-turn-helix (wHTH) protein
MESPHYLTLEPFCLDVTHGRLWRGEHPIALRPRSLAVLQYLVKHPARLVTKAELLQQLWAGTHVTDIVLRVSIREIRAALGDSATTPHYVETVGQEGYRFLVGWGVNHREGGAHLRHRHGRLQSAPMSRRSALGRFWREPASCPRSRGVDHSPSMFWACFPGSFSPKAVNFYLATRMYGLVREWFTSLSNRVTKGDDEPGGVGHVCAVGYGGTHRQTAAATMGRLNGAGAGVRAPAPAGPAPGLRADPQGL